MLYMWLEGGNSTTCQAVKICKVFFIIMYVQLWISTVLLVATLKETSTAGCTFISVLYSSVFHFHRDELQYPRCVKICVLLYHFTFVFNFAPIIYLFGWCRLNKHCNLIVSAKSLWEEASLSTGKTEVSPEMETTSSLIILWGIALKVTSPEEIKKPQASAYESVCMWVVFLWPAHEPLSLSIDIHTNSIYWLLW